MKTVKIISFSSFLITTLLVCFSLARESHRTVGDILKVVTRIEDQLTKEERIRQLTDMVRIETTMDNINKKLDRLLDGIGHNPSARISSPSDLQHVSNFDSSLHSLDDRLARMENALDKVEIGFSQADFSKLEDIDKRSSQLSSELNQKLRKIMNIITALYEMNKEMKTNFGGRSEVQQEAEASQTSGSRYAADFLIENLEELERKIKEQFSVLGNEIRTEITGLKIVASSVSDGCDKSVDFEETPEEFGRSGSKRSSKKDVVKIQQPGAGRSSRVESNTLDSLMQSLGRTTREIREEIHQGIQVIDDKLSNFTHMSCVAGSADDLQTSASHPIGARASRDFQIVPEQTLDNEEQGRPTECTRISKTAVSPKSCAELRFGGANCDGVYVIFPKNIRAVRVYCDMTTEGGGWTLLMRRGDFGSKMTNFHKNWLSYKNGFGDVEGEFWLGNDVFHLLTTQETNKLRVHLESFDGANTDMTYSSFSVSNETDNYRLHLGPSVGGANNAPSNSLKYHSNHPFSTFDKKNDNFEQNCAATYKGGWWFNGCYFGFLTGEYFRPEDKRENWQGMLWYDWKGNAALKGAYMMIRPKNFIIY